MQTELFRKESLDHLASPERLDSLMVVASPRSWIALSACLIAILAAIAWGFLGHATDQVVGSGLLVPQGGIFNVDATAPGSLREVLVHVHSIVAKGDVVARVTQEGLEQQVQDAQARVDRLRQHWDETQPMLEREQSFEQAAIDHKLAQLKDTAAAARERVAYLEGRVKALKTAADQGIVTDDQYHSSVQELAGARDALAATETQAKDLTGQRAAQLAKGGQETFDLERQLRDAEAELTRLRADLDAGSVVRSPMNGQITEVVLDAGERVEPGLPIMRMDDNTAPVTVYLFVPAMGRWLAPGIRVEVEPAGFPREEFGAMVGTIRAVSPAPQSPESVDEVTRNRLLSNRLAGVGDTYKVEVVPEPDPDTYSHYRWTNGKGPQVHFGQGVPVTGRIKIRQRRPIQEVIPALKKWLGGS